MKLNFYSDAGHGWLKVPNKKILELGLENEISDYSYMYGEYSFLEEDGDAAKFDDACRAKGIKITTKTHYSNHSKIRNYSRYNKDMLKPVNVGDKIDVGDNYGVFAVSEIKGSWYYLKDSCGNRCKLSKSQIGWCKRA